MARRNRGTIAVAILAALTASGTTLAASSLLLGTTNTAAAKTTLQSSVNSAVLAIQNTNATGGTGARGLSIVVPSGKPPITVSAGAGKATGLNADQVDGHEAASFGQVRSFAQSTASTSDITALASLGGLDVARGSTVFNGTLHCQLYFSSSVPGHLDGGVITASGAGNDSVDTPVTNEPFGLVATNDASEVGSYVFVNLTTNKAVSVQWSIYNLPSNGGCRWTGTMTTSV
ncbi:MAG TPA: hypothetical protein VGI98_09035 [Candidatus Limnocylindrales bacterium]